jgi:hypothetical protein
MAAFLGAGEEPVLAADGHAPHLSFDEVVVDRDATITREEAERVPLVEEVADRLAAATSKASPG